MQRLTALLRRSGVALLAGLFWMTTAAPDLQAQSPCEDEVTVRSGDTLYRIARRCDTTIAALLAENPRIDDPNVLRVGWQLDVPDGAQPAPTPEPPTPEPDREADAGTYIVRPGDTLGKIADRYGLSAAALMAANPQIDNPNMISVGWRLEIPADKPAAPPVVTDPPATARTLRAMPARGSAGTRVHLKATGFKPHQALRIGFGPKDAEYDLFDRAQADAEGRLSVHVPVPDFARADRPYVFVVVPDGSYDEVISNVYHVRSGTPDRKTPNDDAQPEPVVRAEGVVTGEGVACPTIRADDGTLYTLAGTDLDALDEGDRVYVEGTRAAVSTCMQGTTLQVSHIESR